MKPPRSRIPRRELLTLLTYLEAGSHKDAAYQLAVSESTCRQRVSSLIRRLGAANAAQAAWWLRTDLEHEATIASGFRNRGSEAPGASVGRSE